MNDMTYADIRERFTPEVLCWIAELTNDGLFEAAADIAAKAALARLNDDSEQTEQ